MTLAIPIGDGALRLRLPEGMEPRAALEALQGAAGIVDVVVTETHVCVYFDPAGPIPDPALALRLASTRAAPALRPPEVIRVRYDGPDLEAVALASGMGVEELVRLHEGRSYEVRIIGFLPGFAYLGEVDPRIVAPRLEVPRRRVPKGSVGIAGSRTGIYPFDSPGGWSLVGSAVDFHPFDPVSGARLRLGDRVRFVRV